MTPLQLFSVTHQPLCVLRFWKGQDGAIYVSRLASRVPIGKLILVSPNTPNAVRVWVGNLERFVSRESYEAIMEIAYDLFDNRSFPAAPMVPQGKKHRDFIQQVMAKIESGSSCAEVCQLANSIEKKAIANSLWAKHQNLRRVA